MNKNAKQLLTHLLIIVALMAITIKETEPNISVVHAFTPEAISIQSVTVIQDEKEKIKENEQEEEMMEYPKFTYNKDWTPEEEYLLAKIAMAEAEGESIYTKTFVILTVLNRVHSKQFGNTIKEVIFEEHNGVYQFSPIMPGGRWWTTEPNEECYEAVRMVKDAEYDYSGGILYFESCKDKDNWHSRNLVFMYQSSNLRFYK